MLAATDEFYSVYANPRDIKSPDQTIGILSDILNIDKNEIKEKLQKDKSFIWIKRQINSNDADKIKEKKLKGIGLEKEYKRLYPNNNLGSHILGFCDIDNNGQEGLEKSLNFYLSKNKPFRNIDLKEENRGNDVYLTLDMYIQAFCEKALKEAVINEKAAGGSIILLDGITGEILSLANYPDYDPNDYRNYSQKYFRNYAVFNQYEPGSVFKIFSISTLLDKKSIDKSDYFYCDGLFQEGSINIKCPGIHGSVNYVDVIKYSCNEGMIQAIHNIEDKELYKYLKAFNFGVKSSTFLQGEQSGILRNYDDWSKMSRYTLAIGQEVSVNALQIAKATTVFMNDGVLIEPYIVKRIIKNDNKIILENNRKEIGRVLSKGVSGKIIEAMKTATDPGGTVTRLKIEGINFGAKSGTAQIYDPVKKKYSITEVTSSLLVIFPIERPRFAAYIVFDRPKGNIRWGGVIGSYAFNKFFSSIAVYLNNAGQYYTINDKNIKLTREFKKINALPFEMPDLTGLSAGDALNIFNNVNLKFEVYGSGLVYKHEPQSGETVNEKNVIKLYLKE